MILEMILLFFCMFEDAIKQNELDMEDFLEQLMMTSVQKVRHHVLFLCKTLTSSVFVCLA